MKSIKCMISGGLLILLGPVMSLVDLSFSGFMVLCWFIGIPLFLVGLIMPGGGFPKTGQSEDLPQRVCPECGRKHDFDYPACPHCGHDYQPKRSK